MSDTSNTSSPVADEIADETYEDLGSTPTTEADNAPDETDEEVVV